MRLCTVGTEAGPQAAVVAEHGMVLTSDLLGRPNRGLLGHLEDGELPIIANALGSGRVESCAPVKDPVPQAPFRPRKVLGIGLNYRAHASDLSAKAPESTPASFLKGDHTFVGPGEHIVVPPGIGRVTAEAELGLVIGRECYQVGEDEAMSYVAGVVAVLDQTAEEVLLENPRFLTRVKNYPTFFSFGPHLITLDEVLEQFGDLAATPVATVHNGEVRRRDVVAGMTFSPAQLLSFHSHVMPFYPGDILSTGTPGAVPIRPGDHVACDLGDGFEVLTNDVA
jgi:2-keto-4-pentenoate hydratase/2-oxohepta-3-ene-1,7-dioic acid hydratase in catechol pathway